MKSVFPRMIVCFVFLDLRESYSTPFKCYTCVSLLESKVCGEDFRAIRFLEKECTENKTYCIKIAETAGRTAFMYRKCSENDCDEERKTRELVHFCSVCTDTLCNDSTGWKSCSATVFMVTILIAINAPDVNLY